MALMLSENRLNEKTLDKVIFQKSNNCRKLKVMVSILIYKK